MKSVVLHEFENASALDAALTEFVAQRLRDATATRGGASLVVSGGRTPIEFFRRLAREPLPWRSITITLADERWVAPEHEDSNERLVRAHLLQGEACAAHFIALWNDAPTPEAAALTATQHVQRIARPFDAVVLGMGEDGHTASLFADAPELASALEVEADPACVATTPAHAPHRRLTLNRMALLDSRCIALHITGAHKHAVLERAMAPGALDELPVRCVVYQTKVPCHVFWTD